MAYIESSLIMFHGESHKLLTANLPDENGRMTVGTYGMICRDGQIIWEILGRKGRQVVIPATAYYNYAWYQYTVIIDIDKGIYVSQGSVGQYSTDGFIVCDNGIMINNSAIFAESQYDWRNISVNGAVFYSPKRILSGAVYPRFGVGDSFYGIGYAGNADKLLKLTVDKHGMVEDEEIVNEIEGLSSAVSIKYKGSDYCILYANSRYLRYNLNTHESVQISSDITSGLSWLTDGKFAYIRTVGDTRYLVVTSDFVNDDNVFLMHQGSVYYAPTLYCRYPYVYAWFSSRVTSSTVFTIVKINVTTGEKQEIYPDSIKIGDVTFYAKQSDENGNPQAPYYRLYIYNPAIFWNYNEYFDNGVLKDDLQGGYGSISATSGGTYAIYMDNLELQPSENNMAVSISNY